MHSQTSRLAGRLYETYCEAVGGKAFNGDSLPSWDAFRADPSKRKQSDAWLSVANEAIIAIAVDRVTDDELKPTKPTTTK